jgi:hypothetical protein
MYVCMYVCMYAMYVKPAYVFISLNNVDDKFHTKFEFQSIVQEKNAIKDMKYSHQFDIKLRTIDQLKLSWNLR